MQTAVDDVIDIFTSENTENVTCYFLVKHSNLYNKTRIRSRLDRYVNSTGVRL